jgi:hypothetical protein
LAFGAVPCAYGEVARVKALAARGSLKRSVSRVQRPLSATSGLFPSRHARAMERITARSEGDFYTVLYGSLWVAALSVIWIFCRADPEAPAKYAVEPPEQAKPGWKGEVLEKPSLKVHMP